MDTVVARSTAQESARAVVRRLIEDVINRRDYTLLPDLLHEDYVYRAPGEEWRGPASLRDLFEHYRVAFPDLTVRIDDMFGTDDRVATTFTLTRTHAGPLMELPPTGRRIAVDGIVHSRVQEGRIVEEWELIDMAGLMRQLGLEG